MTDTQIVLGQKCRDRITGYEGVAIARTEWLSKCIHIELQRGSMDPTKLGAPESEWFDEERLEVVAEAKPYEDKGKKRSPGDTPPRRG